jgi:hypothetical protein
MVEQEQCIVCLGDIATNDSTSSADPPEAAAREAGDEQHQHAKSLLRETTLRYHSSYHESTEHAFDATLAACSCIFHTLEACSGSDAAPAATTSNPWTA